MGGDSAKAQEGINTAIFPRFSGRRTEGTTEDEEGGTDIVLANAEGRDGRNAKRVGGYLEMNTATAREVAREKN